MYKILTRSSGPVLGIEVSGKLNIDQERELIAMAEDLLKSHEKISFLVVLGDHVGASFEAAAADLKWLMTHLKQVARVAIVSDSKLLATLVALDAAFAKLVSIEEKHFDKDQIDDAWDWVIPS